METCMKTYVQEDGRTLVGHTCDLPLDHYAQLRPHECHCGLRWPVGSER